MQALKAGNLPEAEKEFREAVRLDPQNAAYPGQLASTLSLEMRFDEACASFSAALKLDPQNLLYRRNLAASQFHSGQLEAARKNLDLLLHINASDQSSRSLMGLILERVGDSAGAVRWLQDLSPQYPENAVALGRAYYSLKQQMKASQLFQNLPPDPMGLEGKLAGVSVAADFGDFKTAHELLEFLQGRYPESEPFLFADAYLAYRSGQFAECQKRLEAILAKGHRSPNLANLRAWCAQALSDKDEAIRLFKQAIRTDPQYEPNYLNLSQVLGNSGQLQEALAVIQEGLAFHPRSANLYDMKGRIQSHLLDHRASVESYRMAVNLLATPSAYQGLALALISAGSIEEGVKTFESALRKFPQNAILHQEFGRSLLLPLVMGKIPEAETRATPMLEKAIRLDPTLSEPHYQLGVLSSQKGRLQEALTQLRTAAHLDPSASKIHYALANTYRRLGDRGKLAEETEKFEQLQKSEKQGGGTNPPPR